MTHPDHRTHPLALIHHAAGRGHDHPSNSLAALETCLDAGVAVVEIDLVPLGDGSLALLHDQDLAADTNGKGLAPRMTRAQVAELFYTKEDTPTEHQVGFLEDAVALLRDYPDTRRLQLDFKPYTPLTRPMIEGLLGLIEPVRDRIQVTSVADWALRALAAASPALSLGFDPLLYLDLVEDQPRPENIPPFRVGAYGLLDDHPLAAFQWGSLADYFAARAESLLLLAPPSCQWFIRAELLKMSRNAGFDWIGYLHQHDALVDGWTINPNQPGQVSLAQDLAEAGIDALTTDDPVLLASALQVETVY